MTSMAAALAASLPAAPVARPTAPEKPVAVKVPQRMEGVIDVDASRDIESVKLGSLVLLKILKHSTDDLPPPPQASLQQDRNPPPTTELSSHPDALGVILGLDLDGALEVEDCFALPSGETSLGPNSYSSRLLGHLREVHTPDSPVGIYLSTHNGGYATRAAIELLTAVENVTKRGRGVLIVHDVSRSVGGDLSVRAYRLSEGAREAAKHGRWDSASLIDNKITAANLLSSLPVTISNPSVLAALASVMTPTESSVSPLGSSSALPRAFSPLVNPLPTSLPTYLSNTLDALTLHSHEANNVAYLQRNLAREKQRHDATVKEREEENARRRKQGLSELPAIGEMRGGSKDPSRLELVCLSGQVDSLAKNMGAEASKGLLRAYM